MLLLLLIIIVIDMHVTYEKIAYKNKEIEL